MTTPSDFLYETGDFRVNSTITFRRIPVADLTAGS
jgi:hypothetical protein